MKALIIKDILHQRGMVVFCAFYSVFFFLMLAFLDSRPDGGFVYVLSGVAVPLMLTVGSLKSQGEGTSSFLLSLPISRRDVVNEKFLFHLTAAVFGLACAGLFGSIAMVPALDLSQRWIKPVDVIRVFSGTLILSPVIPLYFRFGPKAMKVVLVSAMVLGVIVQLSLMLFLTVMPQQFDMVVTWIVDTYRSVPVGRRNLASSGIAVIVGCISYFVSLRVLRRMDY